MKYEHKKALLITIGADTSSVKVNDKYVPNFNGGFRGPFWEEGDRFEYIPIPETIMKHRSNGKWEWTGKYVEGDKNTYGNACGNRLKEAIITNIPSKFREKLRNVAMHHDPNFRDLTYGDGKRYTPRGKQLAKLKPDDLLVFCPSLQNPETRGPDRGRFIIGYFRVEHVFDFTDPEFEKRYECTRSEVIRKYQNKNAHFSAEFAKAWDCSQEELFECYLDEKEADLVLVVGKKEESGLFERAIRITALHGCKYFVMPQNLVRDLGLRKPAKPLRYEKGWKWVEGDPHIRNLISLLRKGQSSM